MTIAGGVQADTDHFKVTADESADFGSAFSDATREYDRIHTAQRRAHGPMTMSLASRLQREGVSDFANSWRTLLKQIGEKSHSVASAVSV